MPLNLELITDSIENNKCVLALGPKLYYKESNGKIIDRQLFVTDVEKDYKSSVYFANEELFSIADDDEKTALLMSLQKFYKGGGDVNLLELISSIKFPLIINASPDLALKEFCDLNEVPLQFLAFDRKELRKEVVEFNKNKPLLYNIMGSVKGWDKIIVEHKELFEHFQKILPLGSMPQSITEFLIGANCFLFLGFEFDSWVFQLISYILLNQKEGEDNKAKKKYSYSKLPEQSVNEILDKKSKFQLKSGDLDRHQTMCVLMDSTLKMQFTDNTPAQLMAKIITALKVPEITKKLSKDDRITRDVNDQEKYSVYLSYAHYNEELLGRESADNIRDKYKSLDLLTHKFIEEFDNKKGQNTHVKLVVDRAVVNYGQSIDSFMTRIGKGKAVVMIVSDKYLTSRYCMTEMFRILQYNNHDKRIFIIWIKDDVQEKIFYQKYWNDHAMTLVSENKSKEEVVTAIEFSREFQFPIRGKSDDLYLEVSLNDIIKGDTVEHELGISLSNKMLKFIDDIFNKLKE